MRLLKRGDDGELSLTGPYLPSTIPPYAILSHTWGKEEVTFQNFRDGTGRDKTNSTELLEAINSMFRWYRDASRCYAYLSDVSITSDGKTLEQYQRPWELAFRQSRWFTRGWTLQELLAPQSVEFFTHDGEPLGNKRDLKEKIHEITNIPIPALLGAPLSEFGVEERLAWVGTRQTTLDEDAAYCLLGIFGVYMPLIYGEGRENAMRRLTKKVNALQNQTVAGENKTLTWQIGPEPLVSHDGYSEAAPALAEFGRDLVAVWRGRNELFGILPNDSLYWATLSRDGDGTPRRGEIKLVHVNAFSRERPAVASLADQLVASVVRWQALGLAETPAFRAH